MNASTHLRDHHRLHAQAVARAGQLRREAVAGLGQGAARVLWQLARRLVREPIGRTGRISRTLEA